MSATTAGALKAFIEAQGLGISAYRDGPPEASIPPYVTVNEAIAVVPDGHGPTGVVETVQVSLWERLRDPTSGARVESYTLAPDLIRALHGAVITTSPTHVYGCRLVNAVRLVEQDANLVQTAITLNLYREL